VAISLSILFFGVAILYGQRPKLPNLAKATAAWVAGAALTVLAYTILYSGTSWINVLTNVKATAELLRYHPIDLLGMYLIYDGTPNLVFIGLGISVYWLCLYSFVGEKFLSSCILAPLSVDILITSLYASLQPGNSFSW